MCVRRSSRSTSLTKTWRKVTFPHCCDHNDQNDQNCPLWSQWSNSYTWKVVNKTGRVKKFRFQDRDTPATTPPKTSTTLTTPSPSVGRDVALPPGNLKTHSGESHLKCGAPARTKSGRIRTTLIGNPDIRFQANEGVQKSISNNIRSFLCFFIENQQFHIEKWWKDCLKRYFERVFWKGMRLTLERRLLIMQSWRSRWERKKSNKKSRWEQLLKLWLNHY